MAETFDPYRKWLGIPPSQQPPHHYRLLGIELYEEDAEVIDTAASQRMSYLQEVGNGPQVKDSQRLLNEVSAARRCLLDKAKKKAYDDDLRAKLAAAAPAPAAPAAPPPVVSAIRAKRVDDDDDDETITINLKEISQSRQKSGATKPPSSTGKTPSSAGKQPAAKSTSAAKTAAASGNADPADQPKPKPRKKRNPLPMLIGIFVLAGVAAGGAFFVLGQKNGDTAAEDEPPIEKVAALPPRSSHTPPRPNYAAANVPSSTTPATASKQTTVANSSTAAAPTPIPTASAPPVNFFAPPSGGGTGTAPKPTPSATAPTAAPSGTAVAAATPTTATPSVPDTPPPASFFGLDTAALPDVRPHFAPAGRTLRDLYGLVRAGDVYHLFYDSAKVDRKGSTVVWSHAVSRDLFQWTDDGSVALPVPAEQTPSPGCVVVDAENASSLGKAGAGPWLSLFTYAASGDAKKGVDVGLTYSLDQGKTWTAYEKNPILKSQPATSRWPFLIRHPTSKQWALLLYVSTLTPTPPPPAKKGAPPPPPTEPPKSTYRLFTSADLADWKQQQEILYPAGAAPAQLVELVDNAATGASKWMFLQGRGRFWLGEFDGTKFMTDRSGGGLQVGPGYFGFRAASGGDPKNLPVIGVLASADGGATSGLSVGFPRHVQLQGGAIAPNRDPVPTAWNGPPKQWSNHDLDPAVPLQVFEAGSLFRVQLQAQAEQAQSIRVTIFGQPTVFNFAAKQYQVGARPAAEYAASVVQIDGVVDVDVAELSIGGVGAVGFRTSSGPDARTPLEIKATGGKARITSLVVTPLKPPKPAQP